MSLALSDLLTCCRGLESDRATERKVNTLLWGGSRVLNFIVQQTLYSPIFTHAPPPLHTHIPRKKLSTSDGSYGTQMWCRSWIVPPDLKPKAPSSSHGMLFLGNLLLYVCIFVSVQQRTHTTSLCHTGNFIHTFIQFVPSFSKISSCIPLPCAQSPVLSAIFFSLLTPQFLPINTFLTYCQIPTALCPEGDREHAVEQIQRHIHHAAQKDG